MIRIVMGRSKSHLMLGAIAAILLCCAVFLLAVAADQVNPRAELWRMVRHGAEGYTAVSSAGHNVLINNGGEIWREFRNILLVNITPWLLGGVLLAIAIFHLIVGGDKLEEPRSGEKIGRYSLFDRILHWFTATLFILLAITGLSILLGRVSLIPLLGHQAFAAYLSAAKVVHNWSGPLFLAGIMLELVFWARENLIHRYDLKWFRNLGGMIGKGPRPHSGKVNGGEKIWFWLMILFGIGVGATGLLLDFPLWGQTRQTMQISLAVHVTVAVLFVAASFGHMYMGTLGSEGAFEGMWRGKVDKVWAKQHADLWYKKIIGEKGDREQP